MTQVAVRHLVLEAPRLATVRTLVQAVGGDVGIPGDFRIDAVAVHGAHRDGQRVKADSLPGRFCGGEASLFQVLKSVCSENHPPRTSAVGALVQRVCARPKQDPRIVGVNGEQPEWPVSTED